jgi:hypothetical protein
MTNSSQKIFHQLGVYVFALFSRLTAYGFEGAIRGRTLTAENEILRMGSDIGLLGAALFLGYIGLQKNDKDICLYQYWGWSTIASLAVIISFYALSYVMFLAMAGQPLAQVFGSCQGNFTFLSSLCVGGIGLCCAAVLTEPVSARNKTKENS